MIIVEKKQEVSQIVNEIDCRVGTVKLSISSFEESSIQHDEFYLVSKEVMLESINTSDKSNGLSSKFKSCLAIIVVGKTCDNLLQIYPNIISFIDDKTPKELILNKITFLNDLIVEKEVLKSQIIGVNQELSEAMGTLELELLKIKKFSEQKKSRRFEDIKGAKLYSKYCAGESSGGEFFDLFKKENLIFIMMSSTSSYLASSSILNIFGEIKASNEISVEVLQRFIGEVIDEVERINQGKTKKIRCNLFTAIIDLTTLKVCGKIYGEYKVLSSNISNNFHGPKEEVLSHSKKIKKAEKNVLFERSLSRGERLLLASPGFVKNWDSTSPGFMIEELLVRSDVRGVDILDEVFFQIKKNKDSEFLSTDAAAILLEVEKNVMLKV